MSSAAWRKVLGRRDRPAAEQARASEGLRNAAYTGLA